MWVRSEAFNAINNGKPYWMVKKVLPAWRSRLEGLRKNRYWSFGPPQKKFCNPSKVQININFGGGGEIDQRRKCKVERRKKWMGDIRERNIQRDTRYVWKVRPNLKGHTDDNRYEITRPVQGYWGKKKQPLRDNAASTGVLRKKKTTVTE